MSGYARKQDDPDVLHHGAVSGTTGSCHELLCDEQHSVLVDCGLFQGGDVSPHGRMVGHLAETARAAVVISGSGMCTGGRIVNYLKAMLHDPRHNVLLVGYQAAGTLGRQLQRIGKQGGELMLNGKTVTVAASVETLGGYPAHADQAGLLRFVKGMRKQPTEVRIVHGDNDAKAALQKLLPGAVIPRLR